MNVVTKQRPLIVHGNGLSKLTLNHLGNYLAKSWSMAEGCALCDQKRITLKVFSNIIIYYARTFCGYLLCYANIQYTIYIFS